MKKLLLFLSLAFSLNAFSQVPSYVPTSGLVGWWPFNGNAIDESVNTNDGTVIGATLTADRFGNVNSAFNFDLNQKIFVSIVNSSSFSTSVWVNLSNFDAGSSYCVNNSFCISHKDNISYGNGFAVGQNNGSWNWLVYNGITNYYQNYSGSLTLLNWYNIILTSDGLGEFKLYINGLLSDQHIATNSIITGGNIYDFIIGAMSDGATNCFFRGKIDDVGYWNRALTPCEIKALYESGTSSITVNASASTICSGGSTTLTASGSTSYTWMPGSLSGNSLLVTPCTTTTYTITGTDGSGCTSTTTSLVNVNLPPSTTPAQTNVSCNGLSNGSATIAATGGTPGYTYSWAPSGGTGATASAIAAGSYTCTVTDANSCSATQSFVITQPAALMAMSSSTAILCNGGSSTVTVNAMDGTAPYTGTGAFTASAGTYSYPVTDANGCSTSTSGTITEPVAITGIQSPSICFGENYQVGTSTYTTFGTYTDILTAFNGCDSTVTTNLTVNSLPSLSVAAADTNVCVSSSAVSLTATPIGGTWSGAGIVGSTFLPSAAGVGTHIIIYTYTDINACSNTAEITMVVSSCTGINEVSNTASFTVYPNPTNSTLTINTKAIYSSIQIVNTLGQLIFTKEKSTSLNVSSLPSGIYFIQLLDNKGSIIGKEKFVKE